MSKSCWLALPYKPKSDCVSPPLFSILVGATICLPTWLQQPPNWTGFHPCPVTVFQFMTWALSLPCIKSCSGSRSTQGKPVFTETMASQSSCYLWPHLLSTQFQPWGIKPGAGSHYPVCSGSSLPDGWGLPSAVACGVDPNSCQQSL